MPATARARRVSPTPSASAPLSRALAAGLAPGPSVGRLLATLRAWWLEGGCTADREACLARLRELAAAPPRG